MAYMILRVVYAVYFLGVAFFMLRAVSEPLFSSEARRQGALSKVPERLGVALIWPVAIFSPAGRKRLKKHLTK